MKLKRIRLVRAEGGQGSSRRIVDGLDTVRCEEFRIVQFFGRVDVAIAVR